VRLVALRQRKETLTRRTMTKHRAQALLHQRLPCTALTVSTSCCSFFYNLPLTYGQNNENHYNTLFMIGTPPLGLGTHTTRSRKYATATLGYSTSGPTVLRRCHPAYLFSNTHSQVPTVLSPTHLLRALSLHQMPRAFTKPMKALFMCSD
jgi:hypothetical protein